MAIAPALGPMNIVWTVQGAARAPSAAPRAYTLALWYARATTSSLAGEPAGSPYVTYDHQPLPKVPSESDAEPRVSGRMV